MRAAMSRWAAATLALPLLAFRIILITMQITLHFGCVHLCQREFPSSSLALREAAECFGFSGIVLVLNKWANYAKHRSFLRGWPTWIRCRLRSPHRARASSPRVVRLLEHLPEVHQRPEQRYIPEPVHAAALALISSQNATIATLCTELEGWRYTCMQPEPQVRQEPQHSSTKYEQMTEAIKKNENNIRSLARTLSNAVEAAISKRQPQQIKLQEKVVEEKMAQHTLDLDRKIVEQTAQLHNDMTLHAVSIDRKVADLTSKLQHDLETLMANMINDVGALLGKGPTATSPSSTCLPSSSSLAPAAPKRPRRPKKGQKQDEMMISSEGEVKLKEPDMNDPDQLISEQSEGEQEATLDAPPGTVVLARHLQTEFLNGRRGCVDRADGSRLRVLFDGDIGYKRVKPENLFVVRAPCSARDCSDTIGGMKDNAAATKRASKASSCPTEPSNNIMTNVPRASSGPYPSTTLTSTMTTTRTHEASAVGAQA